MVKTKHTPLMSQYHAIKSEYSDTLLLFQVGDFYELFFDDAKQAAAFLGIALTARGKNKGEPIPLCGVPLHALDHYLHKLVKGGFKVAICDQLEEPKPGSIVERGVTRVLTPGTLTDTNLLDEKSASYIFSFFPTTDSWGLLFGELLTAQLFATIIPAASDRALEAELTRFFPDEVLVPDTKLSKKYQPYFRRLGYFTTSVQYDPTNQEEREALTQWVQNQFTHTIVKAIDKYESLRLALYYFYAYMRRNQEGALKQFRNISFYKPSDFLIVDAATQRNLELIKNIHDGGRKYTLFSVLDGAKTAMGSRMIKKWLLRPLVNQSAIVQRQDVVQLFMQDNVYMRNVEDILAHIGDVERVVGRIALNRAPLHDYVFLAHVLTVIPKLRALLSTKKDIVLMRIIGDSIADFSALQALLARALSDDPSREWIIKSGFDTTLDRLRELANNSNKKIIELESDEQEKTKIQSLKIRYNQVHGYYIEVTKANVRLVPEHYSRLQTLVGRERYMISALQQLQQEIERAKYQIGTVEKELFEKIKVEVVSHITLLRKLSYALANIDALLGLAQTAYNNDYIRPSFNDQHDIIIEQGRHPVVEQTLKTQFIPNDTLLTQDQFFWVITGPNMGGKSTYLRQVAQICLMAHVGSFVPAQKADIAFLDRIFTRIGAGDNLAEGKSTFLVEMEETASICAQATKSSLVILDEVGRGTSTFDGLAIAQAVVEYLYYQVQARCLFATHYHELTQLQNVCPGMMSYYAASKKTNNGIVFLYTMIKGVADGSFGVEVAKLAQLPPAVIARAHELVSNLTSKSFDISAQSVHQSSESVVPLVEENRRLKIKLAKLAGKIEGEEKVMQALRELDYDNLSPKQAFDLLWEFKD